MKDLELNKTAWKNIFKSALESSIQDTASEILNAYDLSLNETVNFSVKSNQRRVVVSLNPVLMEENLKTKALNRAYELGYEPTLIQTKNPF